MGNRRARTASPHLDYALHGNPFQATAKTFSEAQAVGIVADTFAVLEYHRIDRANASGLGGQLVEQRNDRLFAREGDVQPGEGHAFGGLQQLGQGVDVQLQRVQVDQSIQVAQPLGIAFALVHGGCARGLDAGADQPGQYGGGGVAAHGFAPLSVWLK